MRLLRTARLTVCLAAGALTLAAFQATPATEKSKADQDADKPSIEGKVINATTGDPLKKVTLMLTKSSGGTPVSVETNDKGEFSFTALKPGRYMLLAQRNGFATQMYGARGNALSGTALLLSDGQHMKDLGFKLFPNSVIAGKVLDDDGEPMQNVTVMALSVMYSHGKRQFLPVSVAGQTNDMGEFRIGNLKAGKYTVAATNLIGGAIASAGASNKPPTDKPEPAYATTYYPNATDPATVAPVDVGVGAEVRGIDIRMAKVDSYRVRGKISDISQGKPLMVLLTPKGAGITGMLTRRMGMVQPDGSFEIKGAAPGSYLLTATSDGITTTGVALPVDVKDQHIQGLSMAPASTVELAGTLAVEKDDAAHPTKLKDIQVLLQPVDTFVIMPPKAQVGDDGRFSLKSVSPDHYTVRTTGAPDGYYMKSAKYGQQEIGEDGLDLTNGAAGTVDVTLSPNGAEANGTVKGADGNPIPGVTVVLVPDSRRSSLFQNTTTDQNGGYEFKGVTPGEYKLLAWEDVEMGAYEDPEFLKKYEGKAESLSLKEKDRKTVPLKSIPAER